MNRQKAMRTASFNLYRAMLFGYKPKFIQRLINLRSDHTHREDQFTSRYGRVSYSSTLAGGMNGARFIMNKYSHPERWDFVRILVAAEKEAKMFARACKGAGVTVEEAMAWIKSKPRKGETLQGKNHTKYDKSGAGISYITKYKLWKPSKKNRVCNRECDEVILEGFPEAMDTVDIKGLYEADVDIANGSSSPMKPIPDQADYASMTPSQSHGMLTNFFSRTLMILATLLLLTGCGQREIGYKVERVKYIEPNVMTEIRDTTEINFKSNKLSLDETVEGVTIITPSGWTIKVGPIDMQSHKVELVFDPLTNTYKVKTTE